MGDLADKLIRVAPSGGGGGGGGITFVNHVEGGIGFNGTGLKTLDISALAPASGNLLLFLCYNDNGGTYPDQQIQAGSGWTYIAHNTAWASRHMGYYKISDGTETQIVIDGQYGNGDDLKASVWIVAEFSGASSVTRLGRDVNNGTLTFPYSTGEVALAVGTYRNAEDVNLITAVPSGYTEITTRQSAIWSDDILSSFAYKYNPSANEDPPPFGMPDGEPIDMWSIKP